MRADYSRGDLKLTSQNENVHQNWERTMLQYGCVQTTKLIV
jgi:hypothetical protein